MASIDAHATALEARLNHSFNDPALLTRARSHRSAVLHANESYERLEFLGDRVLGLVVADMLLTRFPEDPEGHLSRRLNGLVRKETLARVARTIDLGDALLVGPSEDADGRDNDSLLADVVEALIAALYIDGGMEAARRFIEGLWTPLLDADVKPPRDGKSGLQEWTMARGLGLPRYEEVGRVGPDHAPVFKIKVTIPGHDPVEADGKSKRIAEQAAAAALLLRLEAKDGD